MRGAQKECGQMTNRWWAERDGTKMKEMCVVARSRYVENCEKSLVYRGFVPRE